MIASLKVFFPSRTAKAPSRVTIPDEVHMISDHISAGHAVGTHTGKRRIGTVAVFNDTAGRRHNITHAKDLTGIDIMNKFLNIIIRRVCKHLLRRIDLHHSAVAQDTYSVTKLKGFVVSWVMKTIVLSQRSWIRSSSNCRSFLTRGSSAEKLHPSEVYQDH